MFQFCHTLFGLRREQIQYLLLTLRQTNFRFKIRIILYHRLALQLQAGRQSSLINIALCTAKLVVTETSYTFISIRLDEREFHNVFDKYYVALCLFANQYTENEEVSADIVQDSFAKLWQIREDFFYLHQVKSFLYTAVRNKALNELEHSKVVFEYAQKVIEKRKDSFFHDAVVEEETCSNT